ncbi:MAG: prepilin-type N-terminal cleavage/methylation domain-containing protein [Patescibacteria group bacterium]
MKSNTSRGFTLTELLIVIAIIGLLAGIILAAISKAREKAQIAKTVIEVKELSKSVYQYYVDTGINPQCAFPCSAINDPLMNSLGVSGWAGPYGVMYGKVHPWGGAFGPTDDYDIDGGGNDYVVDLNDDRPGMGGGDNGGRIPTNVLLEIDRILDDGDLSTGNARANGLDFGGGTVLGEMMIKMTW